MPEPIEAKPEGQDAKAPVVDPSRPLSQQVDRLLHSMPEDKKDDEGDKPKDEDKKDDKVPDKPAGGDKPADEKDSGKGDELPQDAPDDEEEAPAKPLEDLPPAAKYVFDRLPEIEAYGHTEGAKDKVIKVKRLEDLPPDFEFAGGRRAEMAFMAANNAQELNARELLGKYQQEQRQLDYNRLKQQENVDVAADIKGLQREGVLPKFQYAESDSRFNDDPAVKEANEIYAIYEKTNAEYLKAGRTYRVSYRDAADKYYAMQYRNKSKDEPKKEEKKDTRTAEDVEREKSLHKTASRTGEPNEAPRRMPAGSTTRDVIRLYESGRI